MSENKWEELNEDRANELLDLSYNYILAEMEEDGVFENKTDIEREQIEDVAEVAAEYALEFLSYFGKFNLGKIKKVYELAANDKIEEAFELVTQND